MALGEVQAKQAQGMMYKIGIIIYSFIIKSPLSRLNVYICWLAYFLPVVKLHSCQVKI